MMIYDKYFYDRMCFRKKKSVMKLCFYKMVCHRKHELGRLHVETQ